MRNRKKDQPNRKPQAASQEPPLKGYLSLNRKNPKCLAEGCGRTIEDPMTGIFVMHAHECAAFCSPACLAKTVLQSEHQDLIRLHVGKRDLLAALGYAANINFGIAQLPPENTQGVAPSPGYHALNIARVTGTPSGGPAAKYRSGNRNFAG